MNVQLVWATPNAEELITKMARVSAPKNQGNMETAPKLLKYLIQHKHWSPYEMANLCVEINTVRTDAIGEQFRCVKCHKWNRTTSRILVH